MWRVKIAVIGVASVGGVGVEWGPDRWRLYGLALTEAGRRLAAAAASLGQRPRLLAPVPRRLLFAPQDLRTADPTVATDIYAGYFVFAGRALATRGRSPFDFPPLSPAWSEALYGFGWLCHLRAAGTALAKANARALVNEFLTRRADRRLADQTSVLARRLISFLSQSPFVLDGADQAFYKKYLRAIGQGVRTLEHDVVQHPRPERRLVAAISLCYAGLCCEGLDATLRIGTKALARELDRQILADGGHLSRSPRVLMDLLLDLLPLRQVYASRGLDTPDALIRAIDRMLPMLRLFRHGDGTLSHFNAMGVTAPDHLATVLTYDEARGQPISHAPLTGYERIEGGTTLLVAETGPSPAAPYGGEAHGGCLSFELSSGAQRIVVNCGAPRATGEMAQAARTTAAHSTAAIDESSSCRFLTVQGRWIERWLAARLMRRLGPAILTGPRAVPVERGRRSDAFVVTASHDGYRSRFGITHERRWQLAANGDWLEGDDVFHRDSVAAEAPEATIRFHLYPGVKAGRSPDGRVVTLLPPNREVWRFDASAHEARLEESVFFAATDGTRRTEQIVLTVKLGVTPTVRWRFERLAKAPPLPERP